MTVVQRQVPVGRKPRAQQRRGQPSRGPTCPGRPGTARRRKPSPRESPQPRQFYRPNTSRKLTRSSETARPSGGSPTPKAAGCGFFSHRLVPARSDVAWEAGPLGRCGRFRLWLTWYSGAVHQGGSGVWSEVPVRFGRKTPFCAQLCSPGSRSLLSTWKSSVFREVHSVVFLASRCWGSQPTS